MKYSAGLANRALMRVSYFRAGEREGSGCSGLRGQAAWHPRTERKIWGVGAERNGRLGAMSRGASVRNTDPGGILTASACVCLCMSVCSVCVCVCNGASGGFILETFF